MDPRIDLSKVARALEARGLHAIISPDRENARSVIMGLIPEGVSVALGDSATLNQVGLAEELEARGYRVVNPFDRRKLPPKGNPEDLGEQLRLSLQQDVFVTGANAVTLDGKIVSVDGAGNRVAGMIYGAPKVIVVLGQNKVVPDLDSAMKRMEKVICPAHARNRGFQTPCVSRGECVDCRAKERICNVTVVIQGKLFRTETWVILIGEDLGLGWDPDWDEERIEAIRNGYVANSWRPNLH